MGLSRAEKVAEQILEKYQGSFISRRDGLVILKIRKNNEDNIIWIRLSPITSSALVTFRKIIRKHQYDKLILLKLYNRADYVKSESLSIFDEIITSSDKILSCVKEVDSHEDEIRASTSNCRKS